MNAVGFDIECSKKQWDFVNKGDKVSVIYHRCSNQLENIRVLEMSVAKSKDIGDKGKVLFEREVTLNPNSKKAEVADCSVTESSIIIQSTEPLKIPLERIDNCEVIPSPIIVGTTVSVLCMATVTSLYSVSTKCVPHLSLDPIYPLLFTIWIPSSHEVSIDIMGISCKDMA